MFIITQNERRDVPFDSRWSQLQCLSNDIKPTFITWIPTKKLVIQSRDLQYMCSPVSQATTCTTNLSGKESSTVANAPEARCKPYKFDRSMKHGPDLQNTLTIWGNFLSIFAACVPLSL
jgi:hypothetical protein